MIRNITGLALLLACASTQAARPVQTNFSGTFALNAPVQLKDDETAYITATLYRHDAPPCQLAFEAWAHKRQDSKLRELVLMPGSSTLACPGVRPIPVFGTFAIEANARGWTPGQTSVCLKSTRYRCTLEQTVIDAKTFGRWTTWLIADERAKHILSTQ